MKILVGFVRARRQCTASTHLFASLRIAVRAIVPPPPPPISCTVSCLSLRFTKYEICEKILVQAKIREPIEQCYSKNDKVTELQIESIRLF